MTAPTNTVALATTPPPRSRGRSLLRGMRTPGAITGFIIIVLMVFLGVLAPFLTPYSPELQTPDAFLPPSAAHLLGTDEFGRDLLTRVLFGIRQDLIVGVIAVPIGIVVGTILGALSATNRYVDTIIQRTLDVSLAFTGLVMGITVAAIIGPGMPAVLITVALVNVPLFGRLSRNAIRGLVTREYVVAARIVGVRPMRVLFRHILPNALDTLIVQAALSLSMAVFIEGAMSFVGIGIRPPEASLGALLRTSITFLDRAPMYAIAPMIVVTAMVLAFNLIGDGLNKGLLKR